MDVAFRPMTRAYAIEIAKWRYEEPYALNDPDSDGIPAMLDPANAYHAMFSGAGELIGFCCFGRDAQVPGGDYPESEETLDIGAGMWPELTGKGGGNDFVASILEFAREEFSPAIFRVTIATVNERALRVWEQAGFGRTQTFQGQTKRGQHKFAQLIRRADAEIAAARGPGD